MRTKTTARLPSVARTFFLRCRAGWPQRLADSRAVTLAKMTFSSEFPMQASQPSRCLPSSS